MLWSKLKQQIRSLSSFSFPTYNKDGSEAQGAQAIQQEQVLQQQSRQHELLQQQLLQQQLFQQQHHQQPEQHRQQPEQHRQQQQQQQLPQQYHQQQLHPLTVRAQQRFAPPGRELPHPHGPMTFPVVVSPNHQYFYTMERPAGQESGADVGQISPLPGAQQQQREEEETKEEQDEEEDGASLLDASGKGRELPAVDPDAARTEQAEPPEAAPVGELSGSSSKSSSNTSNAKVEDYDEAQQPTTSGSQEKDSSEEDYSF
ncbi:hypothetical protein Efla_006500 [Eimeria flavescens]